MPNLLYTQFIKRVMSNDIDMDTAQFVALLERSTSTYTPNKDDDTLAGFANFVEISVLSYARQNLSGNAVAIDDANDRVTFDVADIAFGALESGQIVKSLVIYVELGDTGTATDDIPFCYIDTDAGGLLPLTLNGGTVTFTINSIGLLYSQQG